MRLIPEKTPINLLKVSSYFAAVIYAVLLLCHVIFKGGFTWRALFGLASLAMISALVAGLGFWLEGRLFFSIFSVSLASGLLYMLYIALFNATPGWGDVTSIIGYMLMAAMGMVAGLAAEYVKYLWKVRPKVKPKPD